MAEKCNSCGAELFAGQQFCRFCGARTLPLAGGETPTQILPAERQVGAADTAPQRPSSAGTDPVLQPPPTSYYAPPQAQQPYPPAHPQAQQTSALSPRRGGSARRWLVALVIIALAGTATLGALLYAIVSRRDAVREMRIIRQPGAAGKIIEHPPMPPAPPATLGGASLLDEDGAQVSGDRTTLTKSFPLKEGALLSLKNLRGDIKIEGWDEPRAEVVIVKRGGTKETRQQARITATSDGRRLTLATLPSKEGSITVDYEIRLPRKLQQIEINSMVSDVAISNFGGGVAVNLQQGDVRLEEIGGAVNTRMVNGHTAVTLTEGQLGGEASAPYNLTTVNGEIELDIDEEVGADIKAEVVTGEIDVDDDLHFTIEKRPIGQHVTGRTGGGGKAIAIKAVSGKIKIH